jgi:lipopolysaccharide/colanic/teichoic acid biosynthesis glycosyltransferase
MDWLNALAKRALDIFVSILGLIVLSPFFLLIRFLIRRTHSGSVIFRGRRIGKGGKEFYILKFRTMSDVSESQAGPKITAQDDPRITPLGRWLRDTKINEIPQLWNVLKGEMSLVGPRPEEMRIVRHYAEWHRQRLLVKPGMTGPMQVDGRGALPLDDRVRMEVEYIEHYSLWSDCCLLLKTIPAVVRGTGAY